MKRRTTTKKKIMTVLLFCIVSTLLVVFLSKNAFNLSNEKSKNKKRLIDTKALIKTPVIKESEVSLIMVGDCLIHGAIYDDAKTSSGNYDFRKMFTNIKPIIEKYDLAFYNQESILGGKELGLSSYPRFNSPKEVGESLTEIGFNLVSLANNHTLDSGTKAIYSSLEFWKNKEDVIAAGSYASEEERLTPKIMEKNGISYALLAYTTTTNGLIRPKNEPYLLTIFDKEEVKKDVENLRDKVDILLVSMHWGEEYTHEPTKEQKEIAYFLASLGVDIVIGHHPHVVQPVEFIDNTMVIYSLGNFISSQYGVDKLTGVMVSVKIKKLSVDKISNITLEEPTAEFVYTDSKITSYRHDYKLYQYDMLTDEILKDYRKHYDRHVEIITSLNKDIKVLPLQKH